MSEWKEYKLGEIADVQTGPFGSQLHQSDYVSVGVPSIMPLNIGNRMDISTDKIAYITEEDATRLARYRVKEGDIVYSRRGDVEKCAYIKEKESGWLCGTGCLRIRIGSKKADSKFVAYYLSTDEMKIWISNNAVGTTMPNLNSSILQQVPLSLPSIEEQRRIASILTSLDDKIDLLRRENATLEAMAETLFRQWFVEEAKEDWEEITLANLIDIGSGKGLQRADFIENGLYSVLGANGEIGRTNKFLVNERDRIIYTGRVGTLGNVFRLEYTKAWLSDNTLVIRPKEYYNFVYFVLKSSRLQDFNVGSTQPLIRQTDIKEIELALPNSDTLNAFEKECDLIYDKVGNNNKQIQTLIQTRDELLPRLMCGELKV